MILHRLVSVISRIEIRLVVAEQHLVRWLRNVNLHQIAGQLRPKFFRELLEVLIRNRRKDMLVCGISNIIASTFWLIDVHSGVVHQLGNDFVNEIVQLFRKRHALIEHCLYGCGIPLEKIVR